MKRKFRIKWKRNGEDQILECKDLSPVQLIARLLNVLRNCSSVEIYKLEIQ